MDASVSSSILTAPTPKVLFFRTSPSSKPTLNFRSKSKGYLLIGNQSLKTRRVAAINDVSAAADAVPVDLTWQIVVGAIAGVTPFVVAGIEFSKRIIAQRRCEADFYHGNRGRDSFLAKSLLFPLPLCFWRRFSQIGALVNLML
nr:uncharacterized protein LOC107435503 isoform X1 [Ziziphus jujuba var. spinosa]